MATEQDGKPKDQLTHFVSLWLMTGVLASGALLGVGVVPAILYNLPRPDGPPPPLRDSVHRMMLGDAVSYMHGGLLLLMITPILRVAILAFGWTAEGKFRFAGIAATVLTFLALSVFFGVG